MAQDAPDPCDWPGNDCASDQGHTTQGQNVAVVWPVSGDANVQDKLTEGFGPRVKGSRFDYHEGIDIRTRHCTGSHCDVRAPWTGLVARIKRPCWDLRASGQTTEPLGCRSRYHKVTLRHLEDGVNFYTFYDHLEPDERLRDLTVGDWVTAGEIFATSGDTGPNIPPHLHFMTFLDSNTYSHSAVNPLRFMGLPQDQTEKPLLEMRADSVFSPDEGEETILRFRVGNTATPDTDQSSCWSSQSCNDQLNINRVRVKIFFDPDGDGDPEFSDEFLIDLDRRLNDGHDAHVTPNSTSVEFDTTTKGHNPVRITLRPEPYNRYKTHRWLNVSMTFPDRWEEETALPQLFTTVSACSSWSYREDRDWDENCTEMSAMFPPTPPDERQSRTGKGVASTNLEILYPADGENVSASSENQIGVWVASDSGIDRVDLLVDGSATSLWDDDQQAPWIFAWHPGPEHMDIMGNPVEATLTAKGLDSSGNLVAEQQISVWVHPTSPEISITAPADGRVLAQSTIRLEARAFDGDPGEGVDSVEFEVKDEDGFVRFSDYGTYHSDDVWTAQWDAIGLPDGNYTVYGRAWDSAGLESEIAVSHISLSTTLASCQPHDLDADPDPNQPSRVTLSWASDGSNFDVYLRQPGEEEWPAPVATGLTQSLYTLTNIQECVNYEWRVGAHCGVDVLWGEARMRSCPSDAPVITPIGNHGFMGEYGLNFLSSSKGYTSISASNYVCSLVGQASGGTYFDIDEHSPSSNTETLTEARARTGVRWGRNVWRIEHDFREDFFSALSFQTASLLCFEDSIASLGWPQAGKPVFKKTVTVPTTNYADTGISTADWFCGVAGWHAYGGDINEDDAGNIIRLYTYPGADPIPTWQVYADFRTHSGEHEAWDVDLLCIDRDIVADGGPDPSTPFFSQWFQGLGDNIDYPTGIPTSDNVCGVIGFQALDGDIDENSYSGNDTKLLATRARRKDGEWRIRADFHTHHHHENWSVQLLCADPNAGWYPPPVIFPPSPSSGPEGGGVRVTIEGHNFWVDMPAFRVDQVLFGTQPALSFTVVDDHHIVAVTPPGQGTVSLTVSSPLGAVTLPNAFTYQPHSSLAPSLTDLHPGFGPPAGNTPVVLKGDQMALTQQVTFGAEPATFRILSNTEVLAYSPAKDFVGTFDVVVTNAYGNSSPLQFTYRAYSDNPELEIAATISLSGDVGGLATGDIDGDGRIDLAVGNPGETEGAVKILLNASSGEGEVSFVESTTTPTQGWLNPKDTRLVAADIDGDHRTDIVAIGGSKEFIVLHNTSNVGSVSFDTYPIGSWATAFGVGVADLDGDGFTDVVTADAVPVGEPDFVIAHRNAAAGPGQIAFDPPVRCSDPGDESTCFLVGGDEQDLHTVDLDRDGKTDVVTADSGSALSVLRNVSSVAAIDFDPGISLKPFAMGTTVTSGDFDRDGWPDLAVVDILDSLARVFRNTCSGAPPCGTLGFAAPVELVAGAKPRGIAVGDVDLDGRLDLVTAAEDSNEIRIFYNTSAGPGAISFTAPQAISLADGPYDLAAGDFDGDGLVDFAVTHSGAPRVTVLRTNAIALPTTPADVSAQAIDPFSLDLTWSPVRWADSITIEGTNDPDLTGFQVFQTLSGTATSFLMAATPDTFYAFRLRAANAGGFSDYSEIVTIATQNTIPPAPTGLTAHALSSTVVGLSWDPLTNATSLHIERTQSPDLTGFQEIVSLGGSFVGWVDTGRVADTFYAYRIRAFNDVGASGPSNVVATVTLSAAQVALDDGWNLVGLPLAVDDSHFQTLFPSATALFGFDGSYTSETHLVEGKGYWLNVPGAENSVIEGSNIQSVTIEVDQGWNMISGPSCRVPVCAISSSPSGILVPNSVFGFNGAYVNASVVKPGEGYWVNATLAGQLTLSCEFEPCFDDSPSSARPTMPPRAPGPKQRLIFEDDFESNDLSGWAGTGIAAGW